MRYNYVIKLIFSTTWCLFLLSGLLSGQSYRIKNFQVENNLPGNVVYALSQDKTGFLWIGTDQGIARFDGFNFHRVEFPDSVYGRRTTALLKDNSGRVWAGCDDGTLYYSLNGSLKQVDISKNGQSSGISCILKDPDGFIYVVPQGNSVLRIDPTHPEVAQTLRTGFADAISSAAFTNSGSLLIGTRGGLSVCSVEKDTLITLKTIEGFDYDRVLAIYQMADTGKIMIGTENNGLYQLQLSRGNDGISRFQDFPDLESIRVRAIIEDSDRNLWISTNGTGVARLTFNMESGSLQSAEFVNAASNLAGNSITTVFQDIEENIWIGHNGKGLSLITSDAFSFYTPGNAVNPNNIIYVNKLDDEYFLGTPEGFYSFDLRSGTAKSYTSLTGVLGKVEISSYHVDNKNNIWIGTRGGGVYLRESTGSARLFYRSGDSGADNINDIAVDDGNLWIASLNGLSIVSANSRMLKGKYDINSGLPHNSVNQLFPSRGGSFLAAMESDRFLRIYADSGVIALDGQMNGTILNKMLAVTEDNKGSIWGATKGNGVFELHNDSVSAITVATGLMSDYNYSILADSEGKIWMGHERGFSKYDPETRLVKSYKTDFAKSGSCNSEGMYESPDGKIFIGTTEGLIVYDRMKDKEKSVAPFNNIISITIDTTTYLFKPSFKLPYKKRYAVRINFIGVNLADPEKVYYSTFLENYDVDWSGVTANREVSYSLSSGRYVFNMSSVNDAGLSDSPISFEIVIKQPVWRTWWFLLSVFISAAGIVLIIIKEREKVLKKREKYLETELAARTKDVIQKTAEIELQNIEITDSITYAKRIQTSILPDISKLKESFSDAFILFHPRDIVSGDFYWFDRVDDNRIIIVCADSTGHGVPGAFMSMIGSTMLQDIVKRQNLTTPSMILRQLDRQIFSALNQNEEFGISNDGMDIVVCEYNSNTRHFRFASAMRPVILVMDGESFYIKGNRLSVGGESTGEKYFDDQEYYLKPGDSVYLFSDGIADQFGGPEGKKMKVTRLRKLIDHLATIPMNEQKEAASKYFYDWKGNNEQVDDVLMMGLKV